jgi:tetratricopeptide (TPR) repeat protein
LEESLKIRREIGDRAGEGATLHNIAHILWQNKSWQQAVKNFMQALQIAREINYAELLFAASRDLGSLLSQVGQKEDGLPLLQQALAVGQQMGHPGVGRVEELLREYSQ